MHEDHDDRAVSMLLAQAQQHLLSRREVLRRAIALGLTAPVIAGLLAACGGDDDDSEDSSNELSADEASTEEETQASEETATEAETEASSGSTEEATETEAESSETASDSTETATEASGGGEVTRAPLLRIIQFQAPTMLNPHMSTGYKDYDASRIAYEPLGDYDMDGNGVPILAAEFPTLDNGGVSEDGMSVTWKLREGVVWQDGEPFTSADVKFTWEWASNPETGAVTIGSFQSVESIETPDDTTVVINFTAPNPGGTVIFTGRNGMILPQHIYKDYTGTVAPDAPANLKPIGTGPFKVVDFKPGDVVIYERHPDYWDAPKPNFDRVELKGGGDSLSAARAVVQTGEEDYAWSAGGPEQVIKEIEASAETGIFIRTPGVGGDRVCIQFANPNEEVDGAFAEPSTKHPLFQHLGVRQSIALAIPRDQLAEQVYGNGATAESNNLAAPPRFVSPNTSWTYDLDQAKAALEEAGVEPTKLVFQTSVSTTRQKTQEVIKQELEKIGYTIEIKAVDPAAFFSSDPGNPDTYTHFYADLEMFTYVPDSVFPILYMTRYLSSAACQKSNGWAGLNVTRYQNPEYDKLWEQANTEMDPDKLNELFIQMNDISVNDVAEIPLVLPIGLRAANKNLAGYEATNWTGPYWDIRNWYMKQE